MIRIHWLILLALATTNSGCVRTPPEIKAFDDATIKNPAMLAKLLDGGLDPNIRSKDHFNEPLLTRAVRLGAVQTVALLLDRGARVDEKSATFKKTPLFQAAYDGRFEIAKLLLDKGANPNALDINNNNPLREAILGQWPAMVRLLRDRGSNPNQKNTDGETMKEIAAKHGTPKIRAILDGKDGT